MEQDVPDNPDELLVQAARQGGKEILFGLSKAGLMFTKRLAEGALNAQLAQAHEESTTEKIRAVGSELGRAFVKGALEGATETLSGFISGVNTFSHEMTKHRDSEGVDDGQAIDDTEPTE